MEINKIVVRFKDGRIMKGKSGDFSPDKTFFNLKLLGGKVVVVDMEKLKAIFFVKDFGGNKNRKDKYTDARPWDGMKIKVQFIDGEVIIGYSIHYTSGHHGFFIVPADLQSNNERIFVIPSATEKITFL